MSPLIGRPNSPRREDRDMANDLGPPESWRFAIPTICSELPEAAVTEHASMGPILRMHEDDWRQIDLLSAILRPSIALAIDEIVTVRRDAEGLTGFDRAYIREGLGDPLAHAAVTVDDLEEAAGGSTKRFAGVGFEQRPGVIADSFAFSTASEVDFYGVCFRGQVRLAGVQVEDPRSLDQIAERLRRFVTSHSLVLVDWVQGSILLP
jgi:hypothetical protein